VALVFTKVVDELVLGLPDEDEVQVPADRAYWETRATESTVALADDLLEIIRTFDPEFELKYNKYYIGLSEDDRPNNFAVFRPRKTGIRLDCRLEPSPELEQRLDEAGLDMLEYSRRSGRYRLRLTRAEIGQHEPLLTDLLNRAYLKSRA
jgi:hypothetical protein